MCVSNTSLMSVKTNWQYPGKMQWKP